MLFNNEFHLIYYSYQQLTNLCHSEYSEVVSSGLNAGMATTMTVSDQ